MSNMKPFFSLALGVAVTVAVAGCGDSHDHAEPSGGEHHHEAKYGGTLVEIGHHEFNLEFVRDAATGTLNAYVLDGHVVNFVRIPLESFEVIAKVGDRTEKLTFKPVANTATGETAGNTSQFQAQADWLKTADSFEGVLKEITIRGNSYTFVAFKFPK
jgi:hypothetical protein